MREIACGVVDRLVEGSCNACQDRVGEKVLMVKLQTISFRLCVECARRLRQMMLEDLITLERELGKQLYKQKGRK